MYCNIKFVERTPSVAMLLSEIEKIAGVDVIFDNFISAIYSKELNSYVYVFDRIDNIYEVSIFKNRLSYLSGVTIYALIKLGGTVEADLPCWVNKPWKEVKKFFFFLPRRIS